MPRSLLVVTCLMLPSCGAATVESDGDATVPAISDTSERPTTTGPTTTARPTTTAATTSSAVTTTTPPPPPTTIVAATTTTIAAATSTNTSSTVATTTTTVAPATAPSVGGYDLTQEIVGVGLSVEGRPIIAERYGTPGGRRVLVIGVIHGDEDAGVQIVERLRADGLSGRVPAGVELWLVESMNPDGQAAQDRHNANQVDLNRNFPHDWGPIGQPGDGQYAGTGPASEPETQAMVAFIGELRPDIALWYHQDANLIIPSTGRHGRIRARYANLTGLPIADCCGGGIYTGVAATWARVTLADRDAVPFIVELPGGVLDDARVQAHADAVLTISAEG